MERDGWGVSKEERSGSADLAATNFSENDGDSTGESVGGEQAAAEQSQVFRMDQTVGMRPSAGRGKLRRTCEYCRHRKRRCDGDGKTRCRYAVHRYNTTEYMCCVLLVIGEEWNSVDVRCAMN